MSMNEMMTKDGTEMKIMTTVEMVLSTQVFFFSAAKTPRAMPRGTEMIMAMMLSLIE